VTCGRSVVFSTNKTDVHDIIVVSYISGSDTLILYLIPLF